MTCCSFFPFAPAFAHLKNLRRLVLNSNRISVIKPFAFKVRKKA